MGANKNRIPGTGGLTHTDHRRLRSPLPILKPVVCSGQRGIRSLEPSVPALSNADDVAFTAEIADGVWAVSILNPVPDRTPSHAHGSSIQGALLLRARTQGQARTAHNINVVITCPLLGAARADTPCTHDDGICGGHARQKARVDARRMT